MIEIYQFRVYLRGISPAIWRRLLLRSDQTIADPHYTLQIAMGWTDTHLNRFLIGGREYGVAHRGGLNFRDDPRQVPLADFCFRPYERFLYEYNFYDNWQHEIRLEKRLPLDRQKSFPLCLGGGRKVPPEECSGPWGFLKLESHYSLPYIAGRLLAITEEEHPSEHRAEVRELMYWLSINEFDRQEVNRKLKQYADGDDAWRWVYL
jgi:hypothetical protein